MAEMDKETMEQEAVQEHERSGTGYTAEQEEAADATGNAQQAAEEEAQEEATEGAEELTEEEASEEGEEEPEEGTEHKSWTEKRAAKKQAKQDKKYDEYKQKIAELEDRSKRQLAEFENYRRRTDKEKQAMFETGAKSIVEKILPVIDNFERGLATVPADKKEDAFVVGMDHIYKQMITELEKIGVKPIEAVGREFDPAFHNAVMQVQSEEYEAGVVAQELMKGYTYRDSVVRHSMVAVVSE